MLLADDTTSSSLFTPFDVFMIVFTVLIVIGLARLLMVRSKKNWFAVGYSTLALIVFLIADVKMVSGW